MRWKFCAECGTKLNAEWKHCPNCGTLIGVQLVQQITVSGPWDLMPIYPLYPQLPTVPTITWGGVEITCHHTGGQRLGSYWLGGAS